MKIEKYLDEMLQKNVFVVIKKHSIAANVFNFTIAAACGACAIFNYFSNENFSWITFATMLVLCIIYAANFLFGVDHLQLIVPAAGKPMKLYKIDDVFFVGCSMEEAQLFATLNKKQDFLIEEFENSVYIFE